MDPNKCLIDAQVNLFFLNVLDATPLTIAFLAVLYLLFVFSDVLGKHVM